MREIVPEHFDLDVTHRGGFADKRLVLEFLDILRLRHDRAVRIGERPIFSFDGLQESSVAFYVSIQPVLIERFQFGFDGQPSATVARPAIISDVMRDIFMAGFRFDRTGESIHN
jgi:hypothetical protein